MDGATPRVDFYLHDTAAFDALAGTACRIAEKAWQQRAPRPIAVRVDTPAQADLLDDLLWTFRDRAFLPHTRLASAPDPTAWPILVCLAGEAVPSTHHELLVNVATSMPEPALGLERVAELVDAEPARRQAGRERFRRWREAGIAPQTHRLTRRA